VSIRQIGCCGAFCATCRELTGGHCHGCKLGYESGERHISKARCKIKVCCFRDRRLETCADCADYASCETIRSFQDKSGYKYRKYKQALDFIRERGYDEFLRLARSWKGPYGRLS
jgi:hypothetical protein